MNLQNLIQDIAREAGEILKRRFHDDNVWRTKTGRGDIVTEIDEESERYIISRIREARPDDRILSEESGTVDAGQGNYTWVIDPLDGTRNYAMHVPFFCVSIGVLDGTQPLAGAIYDPIHDETYFASRGNGAWLNGKPIHVSEENSIEDSVISLAWVKRKVDRTRFISYIEELSRDTSYFRRFGSAALVMAYVACGRLHAYIQGGLNPWDVAAGIVLIEEAGGRVTDFAGDSIDITNPNIEIATANPSLHSFLMSNVIKRK